jgi:hypothetical protein
MLVLYDDRYQPAPVGGGETPPQFAAENNYGQFIYQFQNGVRATPLSREPAAQRSAHWQVWAMLAARAAPFGSTPQQLAAE